MYNVRPYVSKLLCTNPSPPPIGGVFIFSLAQYSGEWVKGKRTGVGAMHFSDGRRFEGEYGDGVAHGYGLAWAPDGRRNDGFKKGDVDVEQWEGMWDDVRPRATHAAGAARTAQLAADAEARAARTQATCLVDYRSGSSGAGGGLVSVLQQERERVERGGGKGARRTGLQPRDGELQRALHEADTRHKIDVPPPILVVPTV